MKIVKKIKGAIKKIIEMCIDCDKYTFEVFLYTTLIAKGIWTFFLTLSLAFASEELCSTIYMHLPVGFAIFFLRFAGFYSLLNKSEIIRKISLFLSAILYLSAAIHMLIIDFSSFVVPASLIMAVFCLITLVDIRKRDT